MGSEVIMDRIIYARADGGVSIVTATDEWQGTLDELARKVVPHGTPYKLVHHSEIPTDRTWRNAWVLDQFVPNGIGEAQ